MAEIDHLSPWWSPARHIDRRPFLAARSAITKAIRAWFDEQGFIEVETGILQISPGNETHLHAPRTELSDSAGRRRHALSCAPRRNSQPRNCWRRVRRKYSNSRGYFATASAATCICRNSPCWSGIAPSEPYEAVMADSIVVIAHAAQATGIGRFSFRGRTADPFAEPELLTVAAAFDRFAGIDLLATIEGRQRRSRGAGRRRPRAGCGSRTTTPGRIFSARCWSNTSSRIWGRGS